jgi:lysophospholipase L1-like esterase
MAFTVQGSVGTSMVAPTGRPMQGHVQYAPTQGAYWVPFLSSTNQLSAVYSTNSGTTWTAPSGSPFTLAGVHGNDGREAGFYVAAIGGVDVMHMVLTYTSGGQNQTLHSRFTLGSTWARTDADILDVSGVLTPAQAAPGGCFDSANHPVDIFNDGTGNPRGGVWPNADAGTSWTHGTLTQGIIWGGAAQNVIEGGVFALASQNLLWVGGDGSTAGPTNTNLEWSRWNGSAWSAGAQVFGSNFTAADPNAVGACARTTSDVHAVALSNNSNTYTHARFNGTAWSAGDAIPNLAYGTNSGISLVSDGTSVWAAVIDTSKNIQTCKWTSGTGWGAWTVLEATRTNTPSFLTGTYNGSNQIMWVWTELNGTNHDIIGSTLATAASTSFTATPGTIPQNHAGNITLTLTGTGTTWTSGSAVSIQNSVSGTTTVTAGTWTRISNTSATLTVHTGAGVGTYTITIDSIVSPTLNTGAPSFTISPVTGQPSTTPTLTLTGTNTVWTQETAAGLFTVTGGSGASIGTPTVTTDTAATVVLTDGSAAGALTITDTSVTGSTATFTVLTVYDLTSPSVYGVYVQIEGAPTLATNFGTSSWAVAYPVGGAFRPEGAIRFKATISTLAVYAYLDGSVVRISIDGTDAGSVTLANTSAYGWTTVSTSLDSANQHEYLLSWGASGNTGMFVAKVGTGGGTGLNTATLAARPLIAFYGDSITQGTTGTGNDATLNWTHHVGRLAGYQVANLGIGSTTVVGSGSSGQARTADLTTLGTVPTVVLIMYGVNDVGVSSTSTFQTAYSSMLTAIRTGLPNAFIICEAIMHYPADSNAQVPYNTAIAAAVAAQANAKTVYRSGGFTNYDQSAGGGLHPSDVGSGQVAAQIASEVISVAGYGGAAPSGGRQPSVRRFS